MLGSFGLENFGVILNGSHVIYCLDQSHVPALYKIASPRRYKYYHRILMTCEYFAFANLFFSDM